MSAAVVLDVVCATLTVAIAVVVVVVAGLQHRARRANCYA